MKKLIFLILTIALAAPSVSKAQSFYGAFTAKASQFKVPLESQSNFMAVEVSAGRSFKKASFGFFYSLSSMQEKVNEGGSFVTKGLDIKSFGLESNVILWKNIYLPLRFGTAKFKQSPAEKLNGKHATIYSIGLGYTLRIARRVYFNLQYLHTQWDINAKVDSNSSNSAGIGLVFSLGEDKCEISRKQNH